ncbi:MAG: indolepyruvate oxidoreductase subunit beta [Spirochaetes bacterium]|nr:indolepyruvate oxidoreductase subunit beta [Spirochaetota bacterium]
MKNVIFAGVGGQGVILASKILMEVAMNAGYDVKESEVHGMAQRGGSVDCNVRYGEKVHSPLIPRAGADYIVSLELLETMRKMEYLAPEGTLIVNREKVDPAPVQTGAMQYPADIEEWVKEHVPGSVFLDTAGALKEAGSKKALNIVMLGVLSNYLEFTEEQWAAGIRSLVKEKFVDMNIKAFTLGRGLKA